MVTLVPPPDVIASPSLVYVSLLTRNPMSILYFFLLQPTGDYRFERLSWKPFPGFLYVFLCLINSYMYNVLPIVSLQPTGDYPFRKAKLETNLVG